MGLKSLESQERVESARDVRVIDLIGSGNAQQAIQLLSTPVAHYYSLYADQSKNAERSKVLAMIEELASTNQVVAARMKEASTNYSPKTP